MWGDYRGITLVSLFEASNSVLTRGVGELYGKMNEAVGIKNFVAMDGGGKWLVLTFKRQELWKCIGCILSKVTYEKKGQKLWSEIPKSFSYKAPPKLRIYVCGNTDLYKVCCDHYRHFYIYAYH